MVGKVEQEARCHECEGLCRMMYPCVVEVERKRPGDGGADLAATGVDVYFSIYFALSPFQ